MLLRQFLERRLTDIDHHLDDLAGEWERSFVQVGNGRAGVAADVEALVGRKKAGYLLLETSLADLFLSEAKAYLTPVLAKGMASWLADCRP